MFITLIMDSNYIIFLPEVLKTDVTFQTNVDQLWNFPVEGASTCKITSSTKYCHFG